MPMESEKKHAYAGRQCMACGGKACNISYEALRDMVEKKQNGDFMAKGGQVKGVHEHNHEGQGNSVAGTFTKSAHKGNTSIPKKELHSWSKDEHKRVLGEMRTMPKPHGHYAEGGEVKPKPSPSPGVAVGSAEDTRLDPDKRKAVGASLANAFGHYAEGGDVESMEPEMDMSADDDMLMDQCAEECMAAIKSGDKGAFKDAMHTMMADFMNKMGKDES